MRDVIPKKERILNMPSITFRPMEEKDFDAYLKGAIASYGTELESIDMVPKGKR